MKKKLKALLQFYKEKKDQQKYGIQLADEDLFFSEIKTNSESKLPVNTIVSLEKAETEILPKIVIQEKSQISSEISELKSQISRPKRELPKSSSIGNMLKDIHQEVVIENKETKIVLTAESLAVLWNEFINTDREKLQNAFLSVAERQQPQLIDDEITFVESNNISLQMLQLHKMEITSFFIKKTTSPSISLIFKLDKKEDLTKNYKTPKDRLKEMIDVNPAVLELIKKLELNLE